MRNPCCIHCENELERHDEVYCLPEGMIHKECMKEHVEEVWEELNLVNKLQLLDLPTQVLNYGDIEDGNAIDRAYESSLEERMAV